jgi:hypothetical protein
MTDEEQEPPEKNESNGLYPTTGALGRAWNNFARSFVPVIPFKQRLFHNMAMKGLKNYHRAAGGDAIGLVATAGQRLDLEPVKFLTAEQRRDRDEPERPGWKSKKRDKTWAAGTEGQVVDWLGKTPVVLLQNDDHVEAGWQRSRVAQALDLGNHRPLFQNPQIEVTPQYQVDFSSAPGAAVTDGGELDLSAEDLDFALQHSGAEIVSPGDFAGDNIIDLASPEGDAGMRISHRKANDWFQSTTTPQEMQMQQDRGYIMGKLGADEPNAFKYLLVAGAIVVLSLLAVFVLPEVLGGGGGGGGGDGGGIVPFMLGAQNLAGALGVA